LIEEIAAVANYEIKLTNAEQNYYQTMHEWQGGQNDIAAVGAGLVGGFDGTTS
jgi:hypothetical protein